MPEFPTYELREIAQLARDHIHSIERILFWIAVPLALLPPIPIKWKWIFTRAIVITLVVWIVLMNFRIEYEVPWNRIVLDIEKSDDLYDGVGGNAALLFIGWIFPFFQSVVTLCVARLILMKIIKPRHLSTEPCAAPNGGPAAQPIVQSAPASRHQ
jgi:hypothetical protein